MDAAGTVRYGVVAADGLVPIDDAPAGGIEDWLRLGAQALETISLAALQAAKPVPLETVRLQAPLQHSRKFLGLGGNYASHLEEVERLGIKVPDTQIWFNKQVSCINGPFDDVVIPAISSQVDYEGELAVVIGRRCRHVPAQRAHDVIAGYMVCNDVSARDVQLRSPTMMLGKSFDTHGPIGPWLVTTAEVADPQSLRIRTWVNGELRQDGNTGEMRYTIADQIAYLSSIFTLEPGDILATGTPAGVAAARRPPQFLKAGDIVRVEIEAIGAIENRFVCDAAAE